MASTRAGIAVRQPQGYSAFIPAPLPPDPPLDLDAGLIAALSEADQCLGRLDGFAEVLPNPELFVAMYVRREAVLSSQIEGTQSTLDDVLKFELDANLRAAPGDVEETVNYIRAMNHGLSRLDDLPLSLRLIREIHRELLQGVRGQERSPGEFRTSQNWIGSQDAPLSAATFVPPPPGAMLEALDGFERFLHRDEPLPALVQCALAHAQFETI
jgi:Fic family protein